MKVHTKKVAALLLTAAMLLSLCACGSGKTTEESPSVSTASAAKTDMTIGALTLFTASNLDPAAEWNGWFDSMFGLGETLFKLDKNMKPQPWLAKSYKYDEQGGQTWTIELRDDVKYTNGEKMTAETVKASLERTLAVCERAKEQLYIDTMDANGQTLTIKTTQASPALLCELCDPMCVIEYVKEGTDYEKAPVLTGPFVAENFVQNDVLTVKRNDSYWSGTPKLEKITFKTYSDGDALTMALQANEIDAAFDLPSTAMKLFTEDKYEKLLTEGSRGEAIFFNCNSEKVADINLRTAIAMAIDRKAFVDMMNGTASVSYGMFPASLSYGGTDKLKLKVTESSSVDTAKALLQQSGYTDSNGTLQKDGKPVSLTFAISSGDTASLFAQSLQSQLKKLGIELQIKTYEATNTVYSDNDFDIGMSGLMMAPTGNPQYFFNLVLVTGGSRNEGHYSSAKVDELAKQLETTYDQSKRDEISFAIEQQTMDDMYYVVFANQDFDCITAKNVKGLSMNPSEYYIVDKDTEVAA